jgi:hypothetical protein
VQVWDAATGGNLIFSEVHPNVKVGSSAKLTLFWARSRQVAFPWRIFLPALRAISM